MTQEEFEKCKKIMSELLAQYWAGEDIDYEKMFELQHQIRAEETRIFWADTYLSYDRGRKIGYWYSFLYSGLREYYYVPISEAPPASVVFPKENYDYMKSQEPDIDSMLPALSDQLGWPLDYMLEGFKG
jgi:hypothetical protein